MDGESGLRAAVSAALILAAVGLVVYGVASGGPAEVLQKAALICLECIGIG